MSAEAAFQSGLLAHLKADAGVAAVLGERVFDLPRSGVRYPFLSSRNLVHFSVAEY